MKTPRLDAHQARMAEVRAAKAVTDEEARMQKLAQAAAVRISKRRAGRPGKGGIGKRKTRELREAVDYYLSGDEGRESLRLKMKKNMLMIMEIDALYATEPWRCGGRNPEAMSANSRMRYLDNIDNVLRVIQGTDSPDRLLTEGVLDAEVVIAKPEEA